jgi:hypothetical protein
MSRRISEYVLWQAFAAGAEDAHGNPVDSWSAPVEVGIYAFDPGSSSEPRASGHDRVIVEPAVYVPSTVAFGPRDRVTARGRVYEVEGETREWRHPNGARKGNVATLRRVDG